MEIALECDNASVFIMDSAGNPVQSFQNVKVKGDTGLCGDNGGNIRVNPGVKMPVIRDGYRRQ